LASLGHAASVTPLMMWTHFDAPPLSAKAGVFAYGVVILVGTLLMGRRTIAGFLVPLAIYAYVAYGFNLGAVALSPALVAAALVIPLRRETGAWPASPRAIGAGIALSLLLLGGSWGARAAQQRARDIERETFMASVPKPDPGQPYPKLFFQKGVNFTAEGPAGYAPERAAGMLDQLRERGVDAIALVPYGFSRRGETSIRFGGGWESSDRVEQISALAHQRGFKVMLKPQLWLNRGYPGDIHFDQPGQRAAWFAEYRRFLEHYAELAARMHADIFVVGVELRQMTPHAAEWRKLIARARQIYRGPLTYGATQGTEFETLAFWDALDYIGLNNYYPLPDDLATADVVHKVEAVQRRFNRPVIFPEAGFASLKDPHRAPWDESRRELSPGDQARCYEAVLRAFYNKPWFQGVYWWKVGTNGYGGPEDGSHTPWRKPAMDVVGRWYQKGGR
ncbi:MAG: glycoside hydrolase family 113, partial [Bryobacteraceae bacterium]